MPRQRFCTEDSVCHRAIRARRNLTRPMELAIIDIVADEGSFTLAQQYFSSMWDPDCKDFTLSRATNAKWDGRCTLPAEGQVGPVPSAPERIHRRTFWTAHAVARLTMRDIMPLHGVRPWRRELKYRLSKATTDKSVTGQLQVRSNDEAEEAGDRVLFGHGTWLRPLFSAHGQNPSAYVSSHS